jgi:alpha-glucosidase
LHEVAEIDEADRQDPTFFRSPGLDVGRDGCRVPLPWTRTGYSFGFGTDGAHLPQPAWFGEDSVEAEEGAHDSTLTLYRRALALRHELQSGEGLAWKDADRADVLWFERPNGWTVVTNFGVEPFPLDRADIVLASSDGPLGVVPGESTVWLDSR